MTFVDVAVCILLECVRVMLVSYQRHISTQSAAHACILKTGTKEETEEKNRVKN